VTVVPRGDGGDDDPHVPGPASLYGWLEIPPEPVIELNL